MRHKPIHYGTVSIAALRQADEFLTRGSQFNGYGAPDPIAAHIALDTILGRLASDICTCGHDRAHHLDREVSDVAGWPCMECHSQACLGFKEQPECERAVQP